MNRPLVAAGFLFVLAAALATVDADVPPPLKQLEGGVPPEDIRCRDDRVLVIRGGGSPACVFPDTAGRIDQDAATVPPDGGAAHPAPAGPGAVEVQNAVGSGTPGCHENRECFIPHVVTVDVGGEVIWTNPDTVPHTVTSGHIGQIDETFDLNSPLPPDTEPYAVTGGYPLDTEPGDAFHSFIFPGEYFRLTFEETGTYPYFCLVHLWMDGVVVVRDEGGGTAAPSQHGTTYGGSTDPPPEDPAGTTDADARTRPAEDLAAARGGTAPPISDTAQALPAPAGTPSVTQYSLPLGTDRIQNWREFTQEIPLEPADVAMLEQNGFVVIPKYRYERMQWVYENFEERVPVYVTPDSVLHMYRVQLSDSLKRIETKYFFDDLWQLSGSLMEASLHQHDSFEDPLLKEAALRNAAYFAVGLLLLEPDEHQSFRNPAEQKDIRFTYEEYWRYAVELPGLASLGAAVDEEAALIGDAAGRSQSPLFEHMLDYSLFAPHGHYTQSEKLKNYFRAMAWYGNPTFPILHENGQTERLMAAQSILMSDVLLGSDDLREKWDRIYAVTSFYVGKSDGLGPYEYRGAYGAAVAGSGAGTDTHDMNLLSDPDVHDALKIEIAKLSAPEIYGGAGSCEIVLPWTTEKADKCLEDSGGFSLMGQRFVPDSYVFSNLVGMEHAGDGAPFTMASTETGPIRGFPSSLDIMHTMLGSERALGILQEQGDASYEGYKRRASELGAEFVSLGAEHWGKNLYWGWLRSLQALLGQYPEGYPTFMRTEAWQDKSLATAAASWSGLRHDTTYAEKGGGGYIPQPPPPPVTGYVEPAPEFYSRMHSLAVQTRDGLDGFGLLDEGARADHDSMISTFERLYHISLRELADEYLSEEDYDFIDGFSGAMLKPLQSPGPYSPNTRTTLVAGVHTEPSTGQVLEVATGYVDLIIVAYALPEGQIVLGAGPVFSYYEFKQPMGDPLTDEAWRQMLASGDAPPRPQWTAGFVSE